MDKRIIKTRQAIYDGFAKALEEVSYDEMKIEDILKASFVSRSTFYAHFKSKEEVLSSINANIFDHVFSHSLKEEATHDFSKSSIFDYNHLLTHILYHLHDEKALITKIINSGCKDIFLNDLRERFDPISERIVKESLLNIKEMPFELKTRKVTEDFIVTIEYWFKNGCQETPEKVSSYLFSF